LARYLEPTLLIPTDGIVLETAQGITQGIASDADKARALYEWIVENTFRDPKTRGCGLGDIKTMLETRYFGGKCADLNALFVGLARAVKIPARDVYGARCADSAEFKSLGKGGDISKAQHCRAEFYLNGYGWVPVDPADVRKVILEEGGGLPAGLADPKAQRARAKLFGAWEMNWLAYNYGHDVKLPNAAEGPVPFLMYPQAETAEARDEREAIGARREPPRAIGEEQHRRHRAQTVGRHHRRRRAERAALRREPDGGAERRPPAGRPERAEQRAHHELSRQPSGAEPREQRGRAGRDRRRRARDGRVEPRDQQHEADQ